MPRMALCISDLICCHLELLESATAVATDVKRELCRARSRSPRPCLSFYDTTQTTPGVGSVVPITAKRPAVLGS